MQTRSEMGLLNALQEDFDDEGGGGAAVGLLAAAVLLVLLGREGPAVEEGQLLRAPQVGRGGPPLHHRHRPQGINREKLIVIVE